MSSELSSELPTEMPKLTAIVLAAGQGTRMRSTLPKPLHPLCGRPMIGHVLAALGLLEPDRVIVVVGHDAESLTRALESLPTPVPVTFAQQIEQLGTGDAVRAALEADPDGADTDADVVILPGDTPLLRAETLARLVDTHRSAGAVATLLTARVDDPTGYGRILRDEDGRVTGVVEQADATPDEAAIDEVNTSIYCFNRGALASALAEIRPDNAQGEWYLTDVIGVLARAGRSVGAWVVDDPEEAQGVNDRAQLATAAAALRARINDAWMRAGVTMVDPSTTYVDVDVHLASDVTIGPGVIIRGRSVVGPGAELGAYAELVDAVVDEGERVETFARVVGDGPGIPS